LPPKKAGNEGGDSNAANAASVSGKANLVSSWAIAVPRKLNDATRQMCRGTKDSILLLVYIILFLW